MSDSDSLDIRRAGPGDAAAIMHLALEVQELHANARPDLFRHGGSETAEELLARMADSEHLYRVATLGDTVIGYVYARVQKEPETRWRFAACTLSIEQMGVAAQYRGRGIGQKLWEEVRDAAVALGVERIVLNVWAFNTTARRFYEKIGFTSFSQRMALELRVANARKD